LSNGGGQQDHVTRTQTERKRRMVCERNRQQWRQKVSEKEREREREKMCCAVKTTAKQQLGSHEPVSFAPAGSFFFCSGRAQQQRKKREAGISGLGSLVDVRELGTYTHTYTHTRTQTSGQVDVDPQLHHPPTSLQRKSQSKRVRGRRGGRLASAVTSIAV
jgi:hypothetical protein